MYDYEIVWTSNEDIMFRNGVGQRPRMVRADRYELIEGVNGSYVNFYNSDGQVVGSVYEMPVMITQHERPA